ncbi:hypothetical protein EDF56_101695 [Novosphingobium sp. PhB165]|uniref:hypothetical protein n=1 Tax=Novosphingobium sp. PhB165 TaxID=2485105 RepID=UPI0010CE7666|nr:hypothetical protein [Novosphingobium sp. PhB165]TCM22015.1 hypothetical protein EDF56_101695 [Novosphingobium sp. PhB165]
MTPRTIPGMGPAMGLTMSLLASLAACGQGSPARKDAEDAHDIAMVERMSKEPFKPILPKPITRIDIDRYGLDKPGCTFRKQGDADPLFIANAEEGFMRIEGDLKRYAAKLESAQLPGNARATYVGLSTWVDLVSLPDKAGGSDNTHWPARLVLHDSQERVAFLADGEVTCRSGPEEAPSTPAPD